MADGLENRRDPFLSFGVLAADSADLLGHGGSGETDRSGLSTTCYLLLLLLLPTATTPTTTKTKGLFFPAPVLFYASNMHAQSVVPVYYVTGIIQK